MPDAPPSIVHPGAYPVPDARQALSRNGLSPRPELASSIVTAVPASSNSTLFAIRASALYMLRDCQSCRAGSGSPVHLRWPETTPMGSDTTAPTPTGELRHRVEDRRGRHGHGLQGRNRITGEIVAIKVIAADTAKNPVLLQRFEQEFMAASVLDHPNVVQALDYCGAGAAPVPGHGVRGRRVARPADRAATGALPGGRGRSGSSPRSARGCSAPTSRGSSTAT